MVIGEQVEGGEAMPPSPQQFPPQKATIENIMSGIENTGAVKMNNHRKKLRQRFDIIKKLGQGTYGKVQLGINKETGQEVAIKTIKKSKIETEADLIRIRREVQIMSSVQHPNIIHIYEVFENREKMVLVMEFAAGGELYDYLSERKVLAEEEARRIFRQVSTAIYYCHKHKICHRDLKLENILLDEHGNAKIADFGLSNVFDEQRLLATFCGSPLYASPEIVKGTPYQGPEVDCWSLGVLLYTLVYGAMPFDGANFKRLVKQISQGDYFEPKKPSRASPLIREMLTVCPSHRANIEQICNHWWVNEGYEESCLDLAEELANQTPVRLDVLLSLAPPSVTADQLLVGNGQEDAKAKDRIQRSHSMGSIVEMGGTEAERRILDMVAAGGEAALMPSPTRTITPAEAATAAGVGSPQAQTKRKLETTVSTENATGAVKKKDKADPPSPAQARIPEDMDVEEAAVAGTPTQAAADEQTAEPVQPTAQEEATKPTDSAAQPNESKFEAQEVLEDLQNLENMCDELLLEAAHTQPPPSEAGANGATEPPPSSPPVKTVSSVRAKLEKLEKGEIGAKPAVPSSTAPLPTVRKVFGKNKTTDLTTAINEVNARKGEPVPLAGSAHRSASSVERKNSLPDESLARTAERRKSRILETAEKFQQLNQQQPGGGDKFKKFVLPGGGVPTVGNYKKEFERKTGLSTSSTFTKPPATTPQGATTGEGESGGSAPSTPPAFAGSAKNLATYQQQQQQQGTDSPPLAATKSDDEVKESDSKSSVGSFSLEDARRSMENSIAMLSRAKPNDSAPSTPTAIDQLCARTESVSMMEDSERERKLKNAREIIGNAIPIGRLRKPPMPFGANGRSTTGTLGINKPYRMGSETPEPRCDTMSIPRKVSIGSIPSPPKDETKTSHAEITLKSATLPRRKLSKPLELQGDAQSKPDHRMQPPLQPPAFAPMRFSTEVQHQMPDLRSAPVGREHPPAFAPMAHQHQQHLHHRANSLEPQGKEQPAGAGPQKPPTYQRTASGAYGGVPSPAQLGRASLSRQSTNESNDSDNTLSQGPMSTNASGLMSGTVSTSGSTTMPIKKSPREYIIPIAVEGGGIVTPRANSLEPSESNASSTGVSGSAGAGFGMKPRLGRPRRLGSLLSEHDGEPGDITSFPRLNRHTSLGRESDTEEPKFHMMHRLRSTRPSKRGTADPNDSASSGEEDDDDGFEILTAENLFSTLLSRVRALTNRLNVNDVNSPRFPASRFMSNLRQTQAPFWHHQDPFGRNLADGGSAANAWRHSMSRDLSTDIDSMFSRSGATLPRVGFRVTLSHVPKAGASSSTHTVTTAPTNLATTASPTSTTTTSSNTTNNNNNNNNNSN
uniref:Protein kinase domain-containing protein n=1 Tax=Anopheles coluzzii TaxID=1518534 RepID=A0A6E8VFN2_ANOCL